MTFKYFISSLKFLIMFASCLTAQIGNAIDPSRRVDWTTAGISYTPKIFENYINVTQHPDYPISPNDGINDAEKLHNQITGRPNREKNYIFYFPAGDYNFSSPRNDFRYLESSGPIIFEKTSDTTAIYNKLNSIGYSVSNYPNPFNPTTTFEYDLLELSEVSLIIYDIAGRKISEVVSGDKNYGHHSIAWNGSLFGNVSSGTYFYRFIAKPLSGSKYFSKSGKLVLIK